MRTGQRYKGCYSSPPLLSQRTAVILLLGVPTAAAAILTVLADGALASGLLAGGGAFVAGVRFFNVIID